MKTAQIRSEFPEKSPSFEKRQNPPPGMKTLHNPISNDFGFSVCYLIHLEIELIRFLYYHNFQKSLFSQFLHDIKDMILIFPKNK